MNILVVDDDQYLCGVIGSYIEKQTDHQVHAVYTGQEALEYLDAVEVDLVILDVNLPDIQGIEILEVIRKQQSSMELPVMMITSLSDQANIIKSFNLGANEFIAKPLNMPIFLVRIQNLLSTRSEFMGTGYRDLAAKLSNRPASEKKRDTPTAKPDSGLVVECNLLVSVAVGAMVFFGKTTHLGAHQLSFTTRELDFPKLKSFEIQIIHRATKAKKLTFMEESREFNGEGRNRTLVVHGKIESSGKWYLDFLNKIQNAFREDGSKGVQAYLAKSAHRTLDSLRETTGNARPHTLTTPAAVSPARLVSKQRYQFQRIIGQGGFASVYLVKDLSLKRSIAMKVLDPKYSESAESRRNFLVEAQIVAQFDHPNIVLVHEVSELLPDDYKSVLDFPENILKSYPTGMVYFTMPYIQGHTIGDINHTTSPPSLAKRVGYMIDMAKALAYAHGMGVVHRDFKPQNIMVTPKDQVIVMDFGIAKTTDENSLSFASEESGITDGEGQFACTPYFAAPEQLSGDAPNLRSDLYSYGLVSYELLSTQKAFSSNNLRELLRQKIQQGPPPLTEMDMEIPAALAELIHHCIHVKPNARPTDAETIVGELSRIRREMNSHTSSSNESGVMALMEQLVVTEQPDEALVLINKLNKIITLYQNLDDPASFKKVSAFLTKTEVLNLILEKNLNQTNIAALESLLYPFRQKLPMALLFQWFQRAEPAWSCEFLAKMLVYSGENNLMPLVMLGLELDDERATYLLQAFADVLADVLADIPAKVLLKWADHTGPFTRATLIALCRDLPDTHEAAQDTLFKLSKQNSSGNGASAAAKQMLDELDP